MHNILYIYIYILASTCTAQEMTSFYIHSYSSLDTITSPQRHWKMDKTAETRLLCTLSKVYTRSWCHNTRGCYHEVPKYQEIKCLNKQQKPGHFSDWPGNEATISDDDFWLQSGYTIIITGNIGLYIWWFGLQNRHKKYWLSYHYTITITT